MAFDALQFGSTKSNLVAFEPMKKAKTATSKTALKLQNITSHFPPTNEKRARA